MLLRLLTLGAAGFLGYKLTTKSRTAPAAFDENEPDGGVRNAGPTAMRDDDGDDWSKTDQELDESFPASDPPANY